MEDEEVFDVNLEETKLDDDDSDILDEIPLNPNEVKALAKKSAATVKEKSAASPTRKAKSIKEDKVLTSTYNTMTEMSEKDIKSGKDIFDSMTNFLKKEAKITPGSGIKSTVPTGIDLLDCVSGGGFVTGVTQTVGLPGSGKSALVARILATCQRKWSGRFQSLYIDTEFSQTQDRLAELGVLYPKIDPYQANTVEKVFNIIEHICAFKEQNPDTLDIPYGIVWDSIANTKPEKALTDEKHHSSVGLRAAMLDFLLPKYAEKLNEYNIALLCVNQLRDKIEMGMGHTINDLRMLTDKKVPGGQALNYNTVQLFYCRQGDHIKEDVFGFPAIKVIGKFIKNKLFTPNVDVELVFTYRRGFSNFLTNYEMLRKYKRLTAGGGFCTVDGYDTSEKYKQKEAIIMYKKDPKFKENWDNLVKEVLQTEYIDKYKADIDIKDIREDVW